MHALCEVKVETNSYGFLRAEWNPNNNPYTSRFATRYGRLPSCEEVQQYATSRIPHMDPNPTGPRLTNPTCGTPTCGTPPRG